MDVIKRLVGPDNVEITTGFIGVQPPSYPINTIYLFTGGPHEAVLGVALKPSAPPVTDELKERCAQRSEAGVAGRHGLVRSRRHRQPGHELRLADADRGGRQGPTLAVEPSVRREGACASWRRSPSLRDLQYAQPLDYPTLQIQIDRDRAGQYGVTASEVARRSSPPRRRAASPSRTTGATRRAATAIRSRSRSRSRRSPRSRMSRICP